jgi:uncharacterized protein
MNERPALLDDAIAWTKARMADTAGHDWHHIERVLANATALARLEDADLLVVQLAAVMHDVVNLPKDHPERKRASTFSADEAAAFLEGRLEPDRISRVHEAIRCHSYSAGLTPESLEARIVSDADKLDSLGAIGIARTFECGGAMHARTLHGDDPFCRTREPDDRRYTVDHFFAKLLNLEPMFHTESGRTEAGRRTGFMRTFLSELEREITSS